MLWRGQIAKFTSACRFDRAGLGGAIRVRFRKPTRPSPGTRLMYEESFSFGIDTEHFVSEISFRLDAACCDSAQIFIHDFLNLQLLRHATETQIP